MFGTVSVLQYVNTQTYYSAYQNTNMYFLPHEVHVDL